MHLAATPEALDELYPLVVGGAVDQLRERMLVLWPPEMGLDLDDVQLLTKFLLAVHREHGVAALPVYSAFAERLKSAGDRGWLQTLAGRAKVVDAYEGFERVKQWLRQLAAQTAPPDDGAVFLMLGRVLMTHDEPAAARSHLSRAVMQSLLGIEWYRLESYDADRPKLRQQEDTGVRLTANGRRNHPLPLNRRTPYPYEPSS